MFQWKGGTDMKNLLQHIKGNPQSLYPILLFLLAALVVLVIAGYEVVVGPVMLRP